ncbi:hypothetical protein K437DRAFT_259582 [Tilletiaria anomala UBC 951]|uniref:ATP-dependent RNA helicase n=1 Tax=Tilletiaria anomala (strain ATCC 24038 / CBS 436.72 / UBC 951) TaxID=1037660 RepID=A0A066VHE1_TILAU|nr:uncharacterized protein K437DRAFT_259582 [Tilletiaria anomala UBC 951]KDN37995.1 hypothetical protein K437DRAFT_259582 [Tilletiaria anomala UBC 951]
MTLSLLAAQVLAAARASRPRSSALRVATTPCTNLQCPASRVRNISHSAEPADLRPSAIGSRTFSTPSPFSELAAKVDSDIPSQSSTERVAKSKVTKGKSTSSPASFEDLGINRRLAVLLTSSYPEVQVPTLAQATIIPALLAKPRSDLIARALTGTGKSFGLLLALLAQPRLRFSNENLEVPVKDPNQDPVKSGQPSEVARREGVQHLAISSIILVPTNELAYQYLNWGRKLIPSSALPSLDPILQIVVNEPGAPSCADQLLKMRTTPPHILIATPSRLLELWEHADLTTGNARKTLGIKTARTLVLDEADALLKLPGRFPSKKLAWKHEKHKPFVLQLLNRIMRSRYTCSSGQGHPSAGMEFTLPEDSPKEASLAPSRHQNAGAMTKPREKVRRTVHLSREQAEEKRMYTRPLSRPNLADMFKDSSPPPDMLPLQLVCVSATANSILRHFLGARTGWLRIGYTEKGSVRGRWLDLMGLSGELKRGMRDGAVLNGPAPAGSDLMSISRPNAQPKDADALLPKELRHFCIVVDQPEPESGLRPHSLKRKEVDGQIPKMRNLYRLPPQVRASNEPQVPEGKRPKPAVVEAWGSNDDKEEADDAIVRATAYAFAVEGAQRALAVIPPFWSIFRTRDRLAELGVPVRIVDREALAELSETTGSVLYLLQSLNTRGLDLPDLSHVFILGWQSAKTTVEYTHLAGRAARMKPLPTRPDSSADHQDVADAFTRPDGTVITILAGLHYKDQHVAFEGGEYLKTVSRGELSMKTILKHLGVSRVPLGLDFFQMQPDEPDSDEN